MKKLFESKAIDCKWNGPFETINIKLETPNLNKDEANIDGDWGPIYKFAANANYSVKVHYPETTINLKVEELVFKSPMLSSEREKTPFYLDFFEPMKALHFKIFFDQNGDIAKTNVSYEASLQNKTEDSIRLAV